MGGEACSHCGSTPPALLRCGGCGQAHYCNQKCQKKGWGGHKASCRPYRVEAIPGKGLGMVAARRLGLGERLLREEPALVRSLSRKEAEGLPSLTEQFEGLGPELQAKVLELWDENPEGPEKEKVLRIFEANAIEASVSGCTALYPTIPRINHSCSPCVVWSWVEGRPLTKEVRAVREIAPGQEITANYIDGYEATFSSCKERQAKLGHWNFVCSCEVCSLPERERASNDEVRKNIGLQHQLIPRYMAAWKVDRAMAAARTKVDLMLSLRAEMASTLPSALLELWEMARIGQEKGVASQEDCGALLQEAGHLAEKLGHRFLHVHRQKVEQVEETVRQVARIRLQEVAAGVK